MNRHRLFATTALALPLAFAPLGAQAADIVAALKDSPQFADFAAAIEKAGLDQTLQGDGPFTVFAPTDAAFDELSQAGQDQHSQMQSSSSQSDQTQASGSQSGKTQASGSESGQQQASSSQSDQTQASGSQSEQQQASSSESGQQEATGAQNPLIQRLDSAQLKQMVSESIVEGQDLRAKDLLGKEQKVKTLSGDQLTVDGAGTLVVLVPTGLRIDRVGDEVFVTREVAAEAMPAVTVSMTDQQNQQQSTQSQSGQQGQQKAEAQSGSEQQGQQKAEAQSQSGQQGQQKAEAQSGSEQQGQQKAEAQSSSEQQGQQQAKQPIHEQQGMLRAAMVVEPDIQADNGVIHAIDQVIMSAKMEKQLMNGHAQSDQQQGQKTK